MNCYDLIINEGFSSKSFQKNAIIEDQQQSIKILFQYPSIYLDFSASEFSTIIPQLSQLSDFYLEVNPYCIISQQSYQQISESISSLNKLTKLTLVIGARCQMRDLSFFQNISSLNLKEFHLTIGKQNMIESNGIIYFKDFLRNQKNLIKFSINIEEGNLLRDQDISNFSEIELSFDCDLDRVNEIGMQHLGGAIQYLVNLQSFSFLNKQKYSYFPGFSYLFSSLRYLVKLNTLKIIFQHEKMLSQFDIQEFCASLNYLKLLNSLEIKGFNLSIIENASNFSGILDEKDNLEILRLSLDKNNQDNQLAQQMGQNLSKANKLKELQLVISVRSNFQDIEFSYIANGILNMAQLMSLNLEIQNGNKIGLIGLQALGNAFKQLYQLKNLNLLLEDQNSAKSEGFFELFEGIKSLKHLISFKMKLIMVQSNHSFKLNKILGETLQKLIKLEILHLNLELKIISQNDIAELSNGLSYLYSLKELVILIKNLEQCSHSEIFQKIKELQTLEKIKIQCFYANYELNIYHYKPLLIGNYPMLKELKLTLSCLSNYHQKDLFSINEGLQKMINLQILDLTFIFSTSLISFDFLQQIIVGISSLEHLEDLFLHFQGSMLNNYKYVPEKYFENKLKNLKCLKLIFQIKNVELLFNYLNRIFKSCNKLVSLSLNLNLPVNVKLCQEILNFIKQFQNLRELELIIFYLQIFNSNLIRHLRDSSNCMSKLYYFAQQQLYQEISQKSLYYEYLQYIPNLVEYKYGKEIDYELNRIKINHLVKQNKDIDFCTIPIEDIVKQNQQCLKNNNLTSLSILFHRFMQPSCYVPFFSYFQNYQQLKQLTLTFKSGVYLTKIEVSQLRIGLSAMTQLQQLSVIADMFEDSTMNKKIIYALGMSLQNIQNIETLSLDIYKDSSFSYKNYISKLSKGIKNQKNLLILSLKLCGFNVEENEIFNIGDILKSLGQLNNFKLTVDKSFCESNLISLREGVSNQISLKNIYLKIKDNSNTNTKGVDLISYELKNLQYLQNVYLDFTGYQNTSKEKTNYLVNTQKNNLQYLQEYVIKLSSDNNFKNLILNGESALINNLKNKKSINYEIYNLQDTQILESFLTDLFIGLNLSNQIIIEFNSNSNKGLETLLKISTNDYIKVDFNIIFELQYQKKCLNLLIPLQQFQQITKLIILFIIFNQSQAKSFLNNSFSLSNIIEINIYFERFNSKEKDNFKIFTLGLKNLCFLKKVTIFFYNIMQPLNLEQFSISLAKLKYIYYLNLKIQYNNPFLDLSKANYTEILESLSKIVKLKFLKIKFTEQVVLKNLKKIIHNKMLRLVNYKLLIEKMYQCMIPNSENQIIDFMNQEEC